MTNKKLKNAANQYLEARQEFLKIANEIEPLTGNDNIIGRIGEFITFQYLADMKRDPKKPDKKNQKGFDLICDKNKTIVSVKTITSENQSGSTTTIKEPWKELIIIYLNNNYKVEKMGILTIKEFEKATKEKHIKSKTPLASKRMLNKKGLIGKYGKIIDSKITKNTCKITNNK